MDYWGDSLGQRDAKAQCNDQGGDDGLKMIQEMTGVLVLEKAVVISVGEVWGPVIESELVENIGGFLNAIMQIQFLDRNKIKVREESIAGEVRGSQAPTLAQN